MCHGHRRGSEYGLRTASFVRPALVDLLRAFSIGVVEDPGAMEPASDAWDFCFRDRMGRGHGTRMCTS